MRLSDAASRTPARVAIQRPCRILDHCSSSPVTQLCQNPLWLTFHVYHHNQRGDRSPSRGGTRQGAAHPGAPPNVPSKLTSSSKQFLDFAALPTYSPSGFIQHISSVTDKPPTHLQAGDRLNCTVNYGKTHFTPIVQANTPALFSWVGSIPGIFTGEHRFNFESIDADQPGKPYRTRLVHEERFTGLLSFLMGQGMLANAAGWRENTRQGFDTFNRDFKAWVEAFRR
ncbi:hypothetical protein CBS147371_10613 [Aspergillus niger]|nr:hypothetical protein CBS147371_10613 [Aspergillus niger]